MAMGKRRERQEALFILAGELPQSPGHPFYRKLNGLLAGSEFDHWIERRCQPYYTTEEKRGHPPLRQTAEEQACEPRRVGLADRSRQPHREDERRHGMLRVYTRRTWRTRPSTSSTWKAICCWRWRFALPIMPTRRRWPTACCKRK